MGRRAWILCLALFLLVGCAARVKKPSPPLVPPPSAIKPVPLPPVGSRTAVPLVRLPAERLPLFADDLNAQSLEKAIETSLRFYKRASANGSRRMEERQFNVDDLRESLIALQEILRGSESDEIKQERIRETFDVYQSTGLDGKNTVLFTGYFESVMNGSLKKTERYKYPIYRTPDDAVQINLGRFKEKYRGEQLVGRVKNGELIPYYNRSEIEEFGSLAGRNLEIAWVDDRIDLFFLHTQGSGKIRLPNGELLQIGYASKNGQPFRSIRTFLLEAGRITPQQSSYRAVKHYLREHLEELPEILGYNSSFVFFRVVKEGPIGSIGEILTPGRSIATDASVFPRGALAFMRARKPILDREGKVETWVPFSRFVINQDAGGMITGAGRVDLFCGTGEEAEALAGSLAEKGELYFLVKKRPNSHSATDDVRP